MNKAHFLYLLVSLFLFSCSKKQEPLLRESVGKINTIAVIMNDALWNGEVGDSLRNRLAAPVFGLPQEEPLFTINQYPDKLVEGFITDSRTLVVVKKGATTGFEIKKNQYAKPQTVFHLTGTTNDTLLYLLEKHSPEMIQMIKEGEIQANQKIKQADWVSSINAAVASGKLTTCPDGGICASVDKKLIRLDK